MGVERRRLILTDGRGTAVHDRHVPGGWSASRSATWKAAENDCLEELDQTVRPIARCDLEAAS